MEERLRQLEQRLAQLEMERTYDFSSLKVFNKSIQVDGMVNLKEYATDPAPAREGAVAYVNGTFRGCKVGGATPTWATLG